MDPFNIIISVGDKQIDLNIHPQGAGENWEAMTAEELEPGGYPVYQYDENSGHEYILLDNDTVQEIGRKIANLQQGVDEA